MIFGTPNIATDVFAGPGPGIFWAYWNIMCQRRNNWDIQVKDDGIWNPADIGDNDWQITPPDLPNIKEC